MACAQHEPAVLAAVHPLERRQLDKVAEQRAGVGTVDVGDSSIPSGVRIEGIEDVIAIWVCPELSDPEGFLANLMEIDSAAERFVLRVARQRRDLEIGPAVLPDAAHDQHGLTRVARPVAVAIGLVRIEGIAAVVGGAGVAGKAAIAEAVGVAVGAQIGAVRRAVLVGVGGRDPCDEEAHLVRRIIRDRDIGDSVAAQVSHRDISRRKPERYPQFGGKSAVSPAQKDAQIVGQRIREDQVGMAVHVEIADLDAPDNHGGGQLGLQFEGAAPGPSEHEDAFVRAHGDVLSAVAVEVREREVERSRSRSVEPGLFEGSVATAEQDAHR